MKGIILRNQNTIWLHVGMWILYGSFWIFMQSRNLRDLPISLAFTSFILAMQMITAYTNVYLLIPRFLTSRRYSNYFILLFCLYLLVFVTIYFVASTMFYESIMANEFKNRGDVFFFSFFITIFSTSFPTLILVLFEKLKAENEARQLEKEKVETELKFLRAQINPHFLFNAINSIFNLIDKDSDEAKEFLVKFSDMLRYHLYETHNDRVSLMTELEYISSYTAMEKLRKGSNLKVRLHIDKDLPFTEVPPLILLSFTENAFKHVSNYHDRSNWIKISLKKSNGKLNFNVLNSKEPVKHSLNGVGKGGIGLDNIKRRLELIYADEHQLSIRDKEEVFEVDLTLNLI